MTNEIEQNKQNIEIGDKVALIYAWREDERPTDANFHLTTVTNVVYRDMGTCKLLKFELAGVDYPVSADRVILIEKADVKLPVFVHINEVKCAATYKAAYAKGFRGFVAARNFDRTAFEVASGGNVYKQVVTYSDITEEIFASCDCLHFVNRRQICKHLSLIGAELFANVYNYERMAA